MPVMVCRRVENGDWRQERPETACSRDCGVEIQSMSFCLRTKGVAVTARASPHFRRLRLALPASLTHLTFRPSAHQMSAGSVGELDRIITG
jgi:hypothetical protein